MSFVFEWGYILFVLAVPFALAGFGLLLLYSLLMRAQVLLLAFAVMLSVLVWGLELIVVIIDDGCVSQVHLMFDLPHPFSFFNTKFLPLLVPPPFVSLTHL